MCVGMGAALEDEGPASFKEEEEEEGTGLEEEADEEIEEEAIFLILGSRSSAFVTPGLAEARCFAFVKTRGFTSSSPSRFRTTPLPLLLEPEEVVAAKPRSALTSTGPTPPCAKGQDERAQS